MGKTSNKVKDEWNRSNYVQIKISVKPETAEAFKAACKAGNVSMASELSIFMANRGMAPVTTGFQEADLLTSRGGRRKLLVALIGKLEQIMEAEDAYKEAIPENLQGSIRYENAEQSVLAMEEALELLNGAF